MVNILFSSVLTSWWFHSLYLVNVVLIFTIFIQLVTDLTTPEYQTYIHTVDSEYNS